MDELRNYEMPISKEEYEEKSGTSDTVGVGEWLVSLLVMSIPCLNIIMMFVWAFGGGKRSKKNYFKAYLIYTGIMIAFVVFLYIFLIGAVIASGSYY